MKVPAKVPESSDKKTTGSLNVFVGPSARTFFLITDLWIGVREGALVVNP